MPAASSSDTLVRQWELLKLIPAHGNGATTSDLYQRLCKAGFQVTLRTVERDLASLCYQSRFPFGPRGSGQKPTCWRWLEGHAIAIPGISIAEALSLNIVENTLRLLLPAALLTVLDGRWRQAREKLNEIAAINRHAGWVDKVRVMPIGPEFRPPAIPEDVLEAVQTALGSDRQLEVSYLRAGADGPWGLVLHPLALVQRGPTTYLLALAGDHDDVRTYALHRIKSAQVIAERARRPEGLDVEAEIALAMRFGSGRRLRLRARVRGTLANILRETPLADDQTLGLPRNGWCSLVASVIDTWELRRWLLGHANELVVSQPAQLRREIVADLKDAFGAYGEEGAETA